MGEESQSLRTHIKLPERLDTNAVPDMKSVLLGAIADGTEEGVVLDASEVAYVGGMCLQLILASRLKVVSCSKEAAEAFVLFGVYSQIVEDRGPEEI